MRAETVLVVDDSQTAIDATRQILEGCVPAYEVVVADGARTGLQFLSTREVDLVLCDLVMEGIDGLKFLNILKGRPEFVDIPVIMLTRSARLTEKVRALEGGAADYLTKPFDAAELIARVRIHLKIRSLQRELRQANVRLQEQSSTDELTLLANRRSLALVSENELSRARRYKTPLSVVMCDLDRFKTINDSYGHVAGDTVLRHVAAAVKEGLRQSDFAARYGGEEIAVLLPQTSAAGAREAAERMRKRIVQLQIPVSGKRLRVTASFGVACFDGNDSMSLDELITQADEALYRAKGNGRNRVCVHGE